MQMQIMQFMVVKILMGFAIRIRSLKWTDGLLVILRYHWMDRTVLVSFNLSIYLTRMILTLVIFLFCVDKRVMTGLSTTLINIFCSLVEAGPTISWYPTQKTSLLGGVIYPSYKPKYLSFTSQFGTHNSTIPPRPKLPSDPSPFVRQI